MTAADIVESGFRHVAVATGAAWRRDGVARWHTQPVPVGPAADVLTPDDLMAGWRPSGSRVYDDDHYYLGGVRGPARQRRRAVPARGHPAARGPGVSTADWLFRGRASAGHWCTVPAER